MPLYECVLIARNDITQAQVDAIADTIVAQAEAPVENGTPGAVRKREYWGLRALAYRINKNRKGHYVLLVLEITPDALNEIERQLRLNEDILRFMTIRIEEVDENPSPALTRKSDDRDRGFRGPKPTGRFDSGRRRSSTGYDDREEFRARDRDDAPHMVGMED